MKTPPLLRSLILSLALLASVPSFAAVKKEFNVCWTIYAGWMPWGTISNEKIIDKWASKYGIKINIVQLNDYIESINQYTAGQFDGCTMTNMDALTIPAAGGVDTTALITGSYSDGNDGVVLKGANKKLSDLKGMAVYLPELSVSHYLLVRSGNAVGDWANRRALSRSSVRFRPYAVKVNAIDHPGDAALLCARSERVLSLLGGRRICTGLRRDQRPDDRI